MAPPFEHISPLRQLPVQQQEQELQAGWPEPLNPAIHGQGEPISTSGIDGVVLVMRHIHSFLAPGSRDPKECATPDGTKALEEAEAGNPVLRYVWLKVAVIRNVPAHKQEAAKKEIVTVQKSFIKNLMKVLYPSNDLSFGAIMESDFMLGTFWVRPDFVLYNPILATRPLDQPHSGWSKQNCQGDIRSAKYSLVEWDGIAHGGLGAYISSLFGCFRDPETSLEVVKAPNFPLVIRVLYTPGVRGSVHISALRSIIIHGPLSEAPGEVCDSGDVMYTLIAVARLRKNSHEDDYVRLYDSMGNHISGPFPGHSKGPATYVSDDWRLGEVMCQYMLFYFKTSAPPNPELPEVYIEDPLGLICDALVDSRLPVWPDSTLASPIPRPNPAAPSPEEEPSRQNISLPSSRRPEQSDERDRETSERPNKRPRKGHNKADRGGREWRGGGGGRGGRGGKGGKGPGGQYMSQDLRQRA